MEKKKKKWVQPELVVLVRRNPEEGLLSGCKLLNEGSGPTDFYNSWCYYDGSPDYTCIYCSEYWTS
jgi:hypothetical protein